MSPIESFEEWCERVIRADGEPLHLTPLQRALLRPVYIVSPVSPPAFKCPRCEAVSFHPRDVEEGYCGRCHAFTHPQALDRILGTLPPPPPPHPGPTA